MLSKIAMVASLLMLGEGAIEVPLTRVTNLASNNGHRINRNLFKVDEYDNYAPRNGVELGGGTGTVHRSYVAEIMIGGQTYKLLCDTGSSDLLVVGEDCVTYNRGATCDPQTAPAGYCTEYGSKKQNTGTYLGEHSGNCYGTPGMITFAKYDLYKADITMAGAEAHEQYLGYIHQQSVGMWGEGENAVDGIIGLAYERLSSIYKLTNGAGKTLMSTISSENGVPNAFAMCFDPSGKGGKMVIGGGEIEGMHFAPLILKSWYTVSMSSISIDGRPLPFTQGLETIVDSGTTNLVVPGQILEGFAARLCPLLRLFKVQCDYNQHGRAVVPRDIAVTPEQLSTLPDITINLNGATLIVSPQSYFTYWGQRDPRQNINYYIYGISHNGYYQSPPDSVAVILGDVALMGHWVYFDAEKGRVGFSNVDHCDHEY